MHDVSDDGKNVTDPVEVDDTPDYSDSEDPNTTASSVVGETLDGRKRRAEANQLRRSIFGKKHDRLGESKEDDSLRRFRYLLGLTDLFRHFIEHSKDENIRKIMQEIDRQNAEQAKSKKAASRRAAGGERTRRTEAEEDAELLKDEKVGAKAAANKDELLSMIQHGAETVFQAKGATGQLAEKGADMTDDDIDAILSAGENRTKQLNAKYEKLGLDDLQKFTSESAYEWNGKDFTNTKKDIGMTWINPAKRERKEQIYSIDKYYKQALQTGGRTADTKPKAPRAPKQIPIQDYQFYPERLKELQERETAYYRKEIGYKVPITDGDEDTLAEREADRDLEQRVIDDATPLTEEEQAEKAELASQGFEEWNRRDFQQFINGSHYYGRSNYEGIASHCQNKNPAEVKQYAKVFWQRYKEVADWQKHIRHIEEGEEKLRKIEHQRKMLRKKMSMYRVPLQQLKINYSVSTTNKKVYSEEEDRFLLVQLDKHGVDSEGIYEKIRDEIRESPLFRFDWFFLSRTAQELGRRCNTLLATIVKEFEDVQPSSKGTNGVNGKQKRELEEDENDEDSVLSVAPAKKKSKPNGAKNKALDSIKSKASSASPSRASSVVSTNSNTASKSKSKGKKK
ncbi:hypothetical protein VSDG_08708 [Cytospora chrysosperma]|uniref:SANT domain-containing protein n=1 Tax=Cytospora chrysosperma TaxID=252740 RepID=A0A423VDY5_CYTCH|nr:hypothetical protein VSDG_08708 [Valsa sordida]